MDITNNIPRDIEPIFDGLNSEVNWIHARWKIYSQVFPKNPEQIALLERTASSFFRIVHDALIESILIGLSRLTDRSSTGGKINQSFLYFRDLLQSRGFSALVKQLNPIVMDLQTTCEPFRAWRNRKIAHADLQTALRLHPEPLPDVPLSKIESALRLVRDYMNTINGFFFNSETEYEHIILRADGETLIHLLALVDEQPTA